MTEAENELVCLRLRTYNAEYVICPEDGYTLIVIHQPNYVQPVVAAAGAGDGVAAGGDERPGTAA
jgi:hypothetical protein